MAVSYACGFCGYEGTDANAQVVEDVLCPVCGEPVLPGRGDEDDD